MEVALYKNRMREDDEERAEQLRNDIIENILNLYCPRCYMVFYDFTNNFALQCGNVACDCHFCAWCLQDAGDFREAQQHVANCSESKQKGKTFFSFADFENHHKARKKRLIEDLIRSEPDGVKAYLKKLMAGDADDLGINFDYRG